MFSRVLGFIATWWWSDTGNFEAEHERATRQSYLDAVDANFVCDENVTNHLCLCEKHIWRLSCFDNRISATASNGLAVENKMHEICRAAGASGAELVQQHGRLRPRQVDSIISAVTSAIGPAPQASYLDQTNSLGVVTGFPEVITSIASQPAVVTSQTVIGTSAIQAPASVIQSPTSELDFASELASLSSVVGGGASSALPSRPVITNAEPTSNTASSTITASQSSASASSSPPSPSSKPSPGLIAGAVIGSVAVLILAGILIMLVLRHKKKYVNTTPIITEGGADKEVWSGQPQMYQQQGNEMATNANVWEMEGHGPPTPWELEAAQGKYGRGGKGDGEGEKELVVDLSLR